MGNLLFGIALGFAATAAWVMLMFPQPLVENGGVDRLSAEVVVERQENRSHLGKVEIQQIAFQLAVKHMVWFTDIRAKDSKLFSGAIHRHYRDRLLRHKFFFDQGELERKFPLEFAPGQKQSILQAYDPDVVHPKRHFFTEVKTLVLYPLSISDDRTKLAGPFAFGKDGSLEIHWGYWEFFNGGWDLIHTESLWTAFDSDGHGVIE